MTKTKVKEALKSKLNKGGLNKVAFTIADNENMKMAQMMINSFRKFHSEDEVDFVIVDQKAVESSNDPNFYYRATPIVAHNLFNRGYKTVLKLDADQIITGSLDFLLNSEGWDIGTVYNWNRSDAKNYAPVQVASISAPEYFNCGLVVMKDPKFVEHWLSLCKSDHFNRLQYKEQDLLNLMCFYGNYKVKCFDDYDPFFDYNAWHGLRSKGEWHRVKLKDGKLILPKGEDKYPESDKVIKVIHWAGGGNEKKMNYKIYFNEEVSKHLDWLVSNEKKAKEPKNSN